MPQALADDLFAHAATRPGDDTPLASRLRPQRLDEVVGQPHLLGPRGILTALVAARRLPSMILVGPPGCGKTTLASLLAAATGARLELLSAVSDGVRELRDRVREAVAQRGQYGARTLLFIDEIHRFNRTQQDALLPHVEAGLITLVGATTEPPNVSCSPALLSRCRLLRLRPLGEADMGALLRRAIAALAAPPLDAGAHAALLQRADGDARRALGLLEVAHALALQRGAGGAQPQDIEAADRETRVGYAGGGSARADVVSALIKSMRASDAEAAAYYLTRMLAGGEDPAFIARRLVIFASEDVGHAAPGALALTVAAAAALKQVGLPEGALALVQAATHLAQAPKSRAVARALAAGQEAQAEHGRLPVPAHLRHVAHPGRTAQRPAGAAGDCLPAGMPRAR